MPRPKSRKHKEQKERFYLLPGQGGKLYRQKQKTIIRWSILAAIFVSLIMIIIMYFTDRHGLGGP
jgi:hypothetical protein